MATVRHCLVNVESERLGSQSSARLVVLPVSRHLSFLSFQVFRVWSFQDGLAPFVGVFFLTHAGWGRH